MSSKAQRRRGGCARLDYSAVGSQAGVIGSPAMILRTKGTEFLSDAFTVAP
jgi:hypothetical protein